MIAIHSNKLDTLLGMLTNEVVCLAQQEPVDRWDTDHPVPVQSK